MTKLHSIFLERNKDINHGQAVANLIINEHLNINALDENNNTILHLMAMYVNDNYYAPYFYKTNPDGKYTNGGYYGYFNYTNYQGPCFFDDLVLFIKLGGNLSLKNKDGETASDLFFNHPDFTGKNLNNYFQLVQTHYPYAEEIIAIITYALKMPSSKKATRAQDILFFKQAPWTDGEFFALLDECILSEDCLEKLVQWVNKFTTHSSIKSLQERLISQLALRKSSPFFIEVINKIDRLYKTHKDIFIRGMLVNEPAYPLFDLINHVYQYYDLEKLLTKNLLENFNQILNYYEEVRNRQETLEPFFSIPLSNEEQKLLKPICKSLYEALNEKIATKAFLAWNTKTGYSEIRQFLEKNKSTFYTENSQIVIKELNTIIQMKGF